MTTNIEISGMRAKVVCCPTCRGNSVFDPSNASRPFCSPRCKNTDLGGWANEEFRVKSDETEIGDDNTKETLL
jgi:uncharacterized protein